MSKARRDRQSRRHTEALERQAVRDSLSSSEQIARLDKLLGVGVGAVKERARLSKEASVPKQTKQTKQDAKPKAKQKAKERRAAEKQNN